MCFIKKHQSLLLFVKTAVYREKNKGYFGKLCTKVIIDYCTGRYIEQALDFKYDFIFMYMHNNHCHRTTAHWQLNILLLESALMPLALRLVNRIGVREQAVGGTL